MLHSCLEGKPTLAEAAHRARRAVIDRKMAQDWAARLQEALE